MFELPTMPVDPSHLEPEERLFVHKTRPQWGVGLWVREERTRRRVCFEDGQMRAFKKGYYDLLEPVDPDRPDFDELFEALAGEHEAVVAEKAAARAREENPPVMSFQEQLQVFTSVYEGGFRSEAYQDAARTRASGNLCKRHVEEEVALAQDLLAKGKLQGLLGTGQFGVVVRSMVDILQRTALVKPAKGHKLLATVDDPRDHKTLALALYRLLYGKKRFRKRFAAWVEALRTTLGEEPSWPLATVFPALVFPEEHVCVKRQVFELQAREVKPGAHIPKKVNRRGYRRARRVAKRVSKQLEQAGRAPRDLLDVRRFVWETLRPKGQKLLEEL